MALGSGKASWRRWHRSTGLNAQRSDWSMDTWEREQPCREHVVLMSSACLRSSPEAREAGGELGSGSRRTPPASPFIVDSFLLLAMPER